jgi:Glycosyltransferase sugar-binding region containing DXD motif
VTIPARAHFCWIGTRLPWAYAFAVLSAAKHGELAEIVLHHTDVLDEDAALAALKQTPRVRLSRVDPIAYLMQAGQKLGAGDGLTVIYPRLTNPAARIDLLRAAILYLEGGLYLDMDTITTRSLLPLLGTRQFVGCEFIIWPHFARTSRSPALWARSLTLDLIRKLMRRMPYGWRMFRLVENFCYRGINNAVMGAEPHSPLFEDYLRAMLALAPERQPQPYALGPDLLQDVVGRYARGDLTIQEPHVFYPLPPEISEHWFRIGRKVRLDAVLSAETRVVHWYASVRTKSRIPLINPDYVRNHRDNQLFSALAWECIYNIPSDPTKM